MAGWREKTSFGADRLGRPPRAPGQHNRKNPPSRTANTMPSSLLAIIVTLCLIPLGSTGTWAQTPEAPPAGADLAGPTLTQAVLCESIENFQPVNPSAVYPVSQGTIMCFTAFDVVPRETEIYHVWIKREERVYRKRLILKPPRWATVSSIKLREADKGPWRVEIRDADGQLYAILRFSITE
jgi:hypothetical protein